MISGIDTSSRSSFFRKFEEELVCEIREEKQKKQFFRGISDRVYQGLYSFFSWEGFESFPSDPAPVHVKDIEPKHNTVEWELNQSAVDIAINDASACASAITPSFIKKWIKHIRNFFIIYFEMDEILDEGQKKNMEKMNFFQRSGQDIQRFMISVNHSFQITYAKSFQAFDYVWKKLDTSVLPKIKRAIRKSFRLISQIFPSGLFLYFKRNFLVMIRGSDEDKKNHANVIKRRF